MKSAVHVNVRFTRCKIENEHELVARDRHTTKHSRTMAHRRYSVPYGGPMTIDGGPSPSGFHNREDLVEAPALWGGTIR